MEKIGIMGGTFNPIHLAHLILAQTALEQFGLSKVLFMPSKTPPHKPLDNIVSNEHRTKMVLLAIEDNPHFELSYLELLREGITYTADTLEELTAQNPQNEYYFIMGADSLFQIETWWEPEKILKLSHIVAAVRGSGTEQNLTRQIDYLTQKYNAKIHLLFTPNMDISSQMLRQNSTLGKSIRYFVPDSLYNYIINNHLYECNEI